MASADHTLPAAGLFRRFLDNGVTHAIWAGDPLQQALHDAAAGDEDTRVLYSASGNAALAVAFGLRLGGSQPVVMMQNRALMNSLDTLRALRFDARVPMLVTATQFGRETSNFGGETASSTRSAVNCVEPALESVGIPFEVLEHADDLDCIDGCFAQAREASCPMVLLLGHPAE